MIKIVIIEDEPHAQRELTRLLEDSSHDISIIGYADSVEEGIQAISNHTADLLFMDIQLSDGLSFEIFEEIDVQTPVIFTTAFDEYAIRAFKVNSVDYLLKPVEPEALEAALDKFTNQKMPQIDMHQVLRAFQHTNKSYKTRWAVKVGDKIKTFQEEDIAYFYADDDALYLVPHDSNAVVIDSTLSHLADKVNPRHFFQISRKILVSYPSIGKVEKYGASQYSVELTPAFPERTLVSRSRTKEFIQWLDQ